MSVPSANSVDPDQMPRCAASGLVCTVSQCVFCGTLGINRLKRQAKLLQRLSFLFIIIYLFFR